MDLKLLARYVTKVYKDAKVQTTKNLTSEQLKAHKSLCTRKDIHISITDKGGEFFVTDPDTYRQVTINHIKSSPEVYKWIEPKRRTKGEERPVARPTDITYRNQIHSKCADIQSQCNKLLRKICRNHEELDNKFEDLFITSCSTLPTMYTEVKTHKLPVDVDFSTVNTIDLKVRPIVACCGGPTEKLAWLVADILKPLLQFVTSNISNIFEHLD